jgi:hypothetical protein
MPIQFIIKKTPKGGFSVKKAIVSFIAGALFMVTATTFADNISLIGKKVTNEFSVKVDGEELQVKAISLSGTSFIPVRVAAEKLGFDVDFANKEVIIIPKQDEEKSSVTKTESELDEELRKADYELGQAINKNILAKQELRNIEYIDQAKRAEREAQLKEEIKGYETEIPKLEARYEDLKKQKEEAAKK